MFIQAKSNNNIDCLVNLDHILDIQLMDDGEIRMWPFDYELCDHGNYYTIGYNDYISLVHNRDIVLQPK